MIREREMALSAGPMEDSMSVNGRLESSTVRVLILA